MAMAPPSCDKGHKTENRPRHIGHYTIGVIVCPTCKRWRPDNTWQTYIVGITKRLRHGGWRRYRTWPNRREEKQ